MYVSIKRRAIEVDSRGNDAEFSASAGQLQVRRETIPGIGTITLTADEEDWEKRPAVARELTLTLNKDDVEKIIDCARKANLIELPGFDDVKTAQQLLERALKNAGR